MIAHTFDEAFSLVRGLVHDFRQSEAEFLSPGYGEAAVRQDFIDRFWMALGWDVTHETQKNPREREVTVEKDVRVEGRGKRADYSFAVAPNYRDVRFFVEAKKPGRQLDNAQDYFQTIRYGWHARTPVAVLTDFEQFRILDCRYKPDIDAVLDYGALEKFHYTDYADEEQFRRIYHLFSRGEVAGGALERYAASLPKQAGRATQRALFARGAYQSIDESFLQDLDGYREQLARAFHAANPRLGGAQLTEATQRTLDRLVFMRFLEDKLIEPDELVEPLALSRTPWAEFVAASRRLNGVYNGIIFREHPLLDAPGFRVDGRVFAGVCENLSHVRSPYDFNLIPIHILGSIYERFLGKTIEVEAGAAVVKEKPEVRKAGGVYYTPEYVVRYIVGETVGRLVEGKTPEQVRPMRFADISCGSGSFLLGVYDLLLGHHESYYNRNKRTRAEGLKAGCVETEEGTLRLSLLQKRTILLNNVYGVDVDAQAVEVAQLSLYLKLLEEETTASARSHQLAFREALLPSLNQNIISGNSLVDFDILSGHLFEPEKERKLNPMNFAQEFPGAMRAGGFDAIVGNPPYVFGRDWKALDISDETKTYLRSKYKSSPYQLDMFSIFMEKALSLCRPSGWVGQIVPNVWLTNTYSSTTRAFILGKSQNLVITAPPQNVFPGLTVDTVIYTLQKAERPGSEFLIKSIRDGKVVEVARHPVEPYANGQRPISTALDDTGSDFVHRLKTNFPELQNFADITRGVHPYRTGGYGQTAFGTGPQTARDVQQRPYHSGVSKRGYRPFIYGRDLRRFTPPVATEFVKYGPWLAEPRRPEFFEGERVYSRKILAERLVVTVETTDSVADQQVYITRPRPKSVSAHYLAGVLGSRLLAFFIRAFYDEVNDAFPQIKVGQLKSLPIPPVKTPDDKARHDLMVKLVEQMLEAKRQLAEAGTEGEGNFYERKCAAIDGQIDALVYELYELTPEEIALVEAG